MCALHMYSDVPVVKILELQLGHSKVSSFMSLLFFFGDLNGSLSVTSSFDLSGISSGLLSSNITSISGF